MESIKNKTLRIVNNIFNIKRGTIVEITAKKDDKVDKIIFKCKCINGNYDLYDLNDNDISWGISDETLNDMRLSLLKDYLDKYYINLKLI